MSGAKDSFAASGGDPRLFAAAHRRGRAIKLDVRDGDVAGGAAPVALRRLPRSICAKKKVQEVSR